MTEEEQEEKGIEFLIMLQKTMFQFIDKNHNEEEIAFLLPSINIGLANIIGAHVFGYNENYKKAREMLVTIFKHASNLMKHNYNKGQH